MFAVTNNTSIKIDIFHLKIQK